MDHKRRTKKTAVRHMTSYDAMIAAVLQSCACARQSATLRQFVLDVHDALAEFEPAWRDETTINPKTEYKRLNTILTKVEVAKVYPCHVCMQFMEDHIVDVCPVNIRTDIQQLQHVG